MNTENLSWSFSRLMVFEQCPYRYKLQFIDRLADNQPRTAADRGTQIHSEAENFVRGKDAFTDNLCHFKLEFQTLLNLYNEGKVSLEEEWAFDPEWKPHDWKTGWLRLKCDAVVHLSPTHAAIIDYKTGKKFGNEIKHARQLQLYALCSLLRYPELQKVTCELWYLDKNDLSRIDLTSKHIQKYLTTFDRAGRQITECTNWQAKPSIHNCKYCPYGIQGDCKAQQADNWTINPTPADSIRQKKLSALQTRLR